MLRVRFAEADRDRYGLPEWLEFSINLPRLREVRALKAALGWDWSELERLVDSDNRDEKIIGRSALWWVLVNRHAEQHVAWDDFDIDILGVDLEVVDPNPPAPDGAAT